MILQVNQTLRFASPWLDGAQSLDHREVPFFERGQVAPAFKGGRGYDQVVSSDHFAHRLQIRPQTRVSIRGLFSVRNDRRRCHDGLKIFSTLGLVWFSPALYSMPQRGQGDSRNCEPIVWPRPCPCGEVEGAPFPADDDVGAKAYAYIS